MVDQWKPDREQLDLEQLIEEHQSMVFSLAWRMTGDRGLAEEIAQDTFLELDRNLSRNFGRIETADHACFWLRRVTMSRATDAMRRRKVRGLDLWVEMEPAHEMGVAENAGAAGSRLGSRLEGLLTALPEGQRAAILLRYQEDMTPQEIAEALEMPVATVKSQLQRGLKLLRARAEGTLREFIR
jgi:RNA polymerase sigma-70 factor (ECF subfamily)